MKILQGYELEIIGSSLNKEDNYIIRKRLQKQILKSLKIGSKIFLGGHKIKDKTYTLQTVLLAKDYIMLLAIE